MPRRRRRDEGAPQRRRRSPTRLLGISKRGDVYLRTLLVHGARSAMRHTPKRNDPKSRWVEQLRKRRGENIAAVALAAKHARILWALMVRGQSVEQPADLGLDRLEQATV